MICVIVIDSAREGCRMVAKQIGRADTLGATAWTPLPRFLLDLVMTLNSGEDTTILATAFDAFIAVLVHRSEVLPQVFVGGRNAVTVAHRCEFGSQASQGGSVKLILMRLLTNECLCDRDMELDGPSNCPIG